MNWKLCEKNNRFKPSATGRIWPLQGAICAACGSPFGVDSGGGRRRCYFCRGRYRSSPHFKRTGEVCRGTDRLDADGVEPLILAEIISTFSKPENTIMCVDAKIAEFRAREVELGREVDPIDAQIAKVDLSISRLAEDWVDGAMTKEQTDRKRRRLRSERESLEHRRDALGPDRLEELERTRWYIQGALDLRKIAEWRASKDWPMGAL